MKDRDAEIWQPLYLPLRALEAIATRARRFERRVKKAAVKTHYLIEELRYANITREQLMARYSR